MTKTDLAYIGAEGQRRGLWKQAFASHDTRGHLALKIIREELILADEVQKRPDLMQLLERK